MASSQTETGAQPTVIHRLLANLRPTRPPAPAPAVLCSPQTFQRWAEDDPWGWSLRGRFYGARGQFLGSRFGLSEEDLARGVVSFGWHTHSAILLPAIADRMNARHSLVVTDISGLLLHHIQTVAAATGHLLLVHDLENPAQSCGLNLCDWLDGAAEARAVATTLLLGRGRRNSSKNKTWRRVAVDLVAACALHFQNLSEALAARQNALRLTKDLIHSQAPGVAELVADLKKLVTKNPGLAHRMVASALDTGLALWAQPDSGPLHEISSYNSLDTSASLSAGMVSQLAHVPTVMVLRCDRRRRTSHGPYLGALLQALVARLHRIIEEWPGKRVLLPVGLILDDLATLGRPSFLANSATRASPSWPPPNR